MERTRIAAALRACSLGIVSVFVLEACAASQTRTSDERPASASASHTEDGDGGVVDKAGTIITQPVRDVGIAETEIPEVLQKASEDPYSLQGAQTCGKLANAIWALNDVLGSDFSTGEQRKENRTGKIAEAGGKTVVNALIPFRGLVREISGAAPAQRRLNAAIDTGFARRGFLRGVYQARNCHVRGGLERRSDAKRPEDGR